MELQTLAAEIAGKIHEANYSPDIEDALLGAVLDASETLGCPADEVWDAVREQLRTHFYH